MKPPRFWMVSATSCGLPEASAPSYIFKSPDFTFHNFIGVVKDEFIPVLNWENTDYKWCDINDMPTDLHFGVHKLFDNIDAQYLINNITGKELKIDEGGYLHGSRNNFCDSGFHLENRGEGQGENIWGNGVYLTKDKHLATFYAKYVPDKKERDLIEDKVAKELGFSTYDEIPYDYDDEKYKRKFGMYLKNDLFNQYFKKYVESDPNRGIIYKTTLFKGEDKDDYKIIDFSGDNIYKRDEADLENIMDNLIKHKSKYISRIKTFLSKYGFEFDSKKYDEDFKYFFRDAKEYLKDFEGNQKRGYYVLPNLGYDLKRLFKPEVARYAKDWNKKYTPLTDDVKDEMRKKANAEKEYNISDFFKEAGYDALIYDFSPSIVPFKADDEHHGKAIVVFNPEDVIIEECNLLDNPKKKTKKTVDKISNVDLEVRIELLTDMLVDDPNNVALKDRIELLKEMLVEAPLITMEEGGDQKTIIVESVEDGIDTFTYVTINKDAILEHGGDLNKSLDATLILADGSQADMTYEQMSCILNNIKSENANINAYSRSLIDLGINISDTRKHKMEEGGSIPSDEFYYFGFFDNETKQLKNIARLRVDQMGTKTHIKMLDSASDRKLYLKEIPKSVHDNFSILGDNVFDHDIEYKNGGSVDIEYMYLGFFDTTKKLILTSRIKEDQMISLTFARLIKSSLEKGLYVKEINKDMYENHSQFEEQIDNLKTGGTMTTVDFRIDNIPRMDIYEYALTIKKHYPIVWDMGNREKADDMFNILERVVKRGHWNPEEIGWYVKWNSYTYRHQHDYRIVGVVSMLKRLCEIDQGLDFMKSVIDKEIKQQYRD